ncbi:hypothetical protein KHA80_10540 [Anaerobacillus sp. HL2]|nr:hypothetical protein KHA80_10540 [Anaerobacillus sp. HL2]
MVKSNKAKLFKKIQLLLLLLTNLPRWLENRYINFISETLQDITSCRIKVKIVIPQNNEENEERSHCKYS